MCRRLLVSILALVALLALPTSPEIDWAVVWAFAAALAVMALLVLILRVIAAAVIGTIRAHRSTFGFGDDCFVVRDGVLLLQTKVVPLSKIQAVSIEESLAQRLVGAGTVLIDVAGTSGRWPVRVADIEIDRAIVLAKRLSDAASERALPDGV